MINTIIFDIGMVLANFCWQDYLKSFQYEDKTYEAVANAMFLSPAWNEYDRSEHSDEDILQMFIHNAPDYRTEIIQVFDTIGKTVQTYDYAVPWIMDLKSKGYKIYILSNFPSRTYKQASQSMKFLDYVDGQILSFQIKKVKPEPGIYKALLEKYQIKPTEAVFLDDLPQNLKGAEAFKIHTILFTTRESAIRQLKELGVDKRRIR